MRFSLIGLALTLGLLLPAATGQAETPKAISYQAALTDGAGNPVTTTVEVIFTIYDAGSGGTPLWTETHPIQPDAAGRFNQVLGKATPLTATVLDESPRFLGIQVGADPELTPRTELLSTPYAVRVQTIDKAVAGAVKGTVTVIPTSPGGTDAALYVQDSSGQNAVSISTVADQVMFVIKGPGGDETAMTGSSVFMGNGTETLLGLSSTGNLFGQDLIIGTGNISKRNSEREQAGYSVTMGYDCYNGGYNCQILGGSHQYIPDGTQDVTISGGTSDTALGQGSVILGGVINKTTGDGYATAVLGGTRNVADSSFAVVCGGEENQALGWTAAVIGGKSNVASGRYSFAAGQESQANGEVSMALGRMAHANHIGCFVWGSGTIDTIASTAPNQFLIRSDGGVGINVNDPWYPYVDLDMSRTIRIRNIPGAGEQYSPVVVDDSGLLKKGWWPSGSASGWTDGGTTVYPTSLNDSVGIGTNTPTEMLDVNGNILASGTITAGTGSKSSGNIILDPTQGTISFDGDRLAFDAGEVYSEGRFIVGHPGNPDVVDIFHDTIFIGPRLVDSTKIRLTREGVVAFGDAARSSLDAGGLVLYDYGDAEHTAQFMLDGLSFQQNDSGRMSVNSSGLALNVGFDTTLIEHDRISLRTSSKGYATEILPGQITIEIPGDSMSWLRLTETGIEVPDDTLCYVIPACAGFIPESHAANYYRSPSGGILTSNGPWATYDTVSFFAEAHLPEGVEVIALEAYAYDGSATDNIAFSYCRQQGTTSTTIATVVSSGSAGWSRISIPLSHVVINDCNRSYYVRAVTRNGANMFGNVYLKYRTNKYH